MSDGMFLSACREVSKEFPDVAYDEDLLDRVCLRVGISQRQLLLFSRFTPLRSLPILNPILTVSWSCQICMATFCLTCVLDLLEDWALPPLAILDA